VSSGCDYDYFVVIAGGDFLAPWFFGSGLGPGGIEPREIDHVVFVYEFGWRERLVQSGFRLLSDGSSLWPLIRAAEADNACKSHDRSLVASPSPDIGRRHLHARLAGSSRNQS
jgi:hypothetical protein